MIAPADVLLEITPRNIEGLAGFDFTRATPAWQLNASGIYEQVSSGQVRNGHYIDGVRYILTEPAATNNISDSTYFDAGSTAWNSNANLSTADASSLFDGETAIEFTTTASPGSNGISEDIGTLTGSPETVSMIVEQGADNDAASLGIRDQTAGAWVGIVNITDWDAGTVELRNNDAGSSASVGSEALGTGPNGGKVLRIWLTVTPNNSGNSRRVVAYSHGVLAADSQIGTTCVLHHVQHEELGAPTSPIVTTGSADTRNEDDPRILNAGISPQEMSMYLDRLFFGTVQATAEQGWSFGTPGGSPRFRHQFSVAAMSPGLEGFDGGAPFIRVDTALSPAPSYGDRIESLATLTGATSAMTGTITARLNGDPASDDTATDADTSDYSSGFQDDHFYLTGAVGGGAGIFAIRRILVASGDQAFDDMIAGPKRPDLRLPGVTKKGWL